MSEGLDAITTGAIAVSAGISTRTFFNYYPNKEAAAIGMPPAFRDADKAALSTGRNALATDIKQFLDKHIAALAEDEKTLRMVRKVVHANIKAGSVLDRVLLAKRDELAECLRARIDDEQVALSLATNAMSCTSRAIHFWESEESVPLSQAFDIIWVGQIAAARLLSSPSD